MASEFGFYLERELREFLLPLLGPSRHSINNCPDTPFSLDRGACSADPSIHAPAAPDGPIFAEQVLEGGPQIGSERADP